MKYAFDVYQTQVNGHVFWVAESKILNGCVAQGETIEEAIEELQVNERAWLEMAEEYDIPIPDNVVKKCEDYSGKFMVRVSPLVHEEASKNAKRQGISLNQYVNNAIVATNTATTALDAIKPVISEVREMYSLTLKELKTQSKVEYMPVPKMQERFKIISNKISSSLA